MLQSLIKTGCSNWAAYKGASTSPVRKFDTASDRRIMLEGVWRILFLNTMTMTTRFSNVASTATPMQRKAKVYFHSSLGRCERVVLQYVSLLLHDVVLHGTIFFVYFLFLFFLPSLPIVIIKHHYPHWNRKQQRVVCLMFSSSQIKFFYSFILQWFS